MDSIQEFSDTLLGDGGTATKKENEEKSYNAAGDLIGASAALDGTSDFVPSQISTAASQIDSAQPPAVIANNKNPKNTTNNNTMISKELAVQLFLKAR